MQFGLFFEWAMIYIFILICLYTFDATGKKIQRLTVLNEKQADVHHKKIKESSG